MNRFEKTAKRIQDRFCVHIEWAPANREYVVDGCPTSNAREAERRAKEAQDAMNRVNDHWKNT